MGNSDSRTIFRDQIQILVNENITQDRFDFWDMLFSIPITHTDVYSMIPDADLENLLSNRRDNLIRLYDFCINILEDLLTSQDIKGSKTTVASNAAKILTRLIPFMGNDDELMWDNDRRALKLVKLIHKLFFLPGFTLNERTAADQSIEYSSVDSNRLWEHGLKKLAPTGATSAAIWSNRYDMIKLLQNLVSLELYREYNKSCVNYAGLFTVSKGNEMASQLIYSILNTVISANPLGNWKLPYSSYFSNEFQEKTIQTSIHVLASLSYINRAQFEDVEKLQKCEIDEESLNSNVFVDKIKEINSENDFNLIFLAIKELIQMRIISQNTYLPGSVREIPYQPEVIVFFWLFIKFNPNFKTYLSTREDIYELFPPLVQFLSSADFYIGSITTYIILHLSTYRVISCSLNNQFPSITTDLPLFSGNYGDFVIISLTRYIFTASSHYNLLIPYFLMAICNISAYLRTLCPLACSSLVRLLEKFSTKSQIFESATSHYSLFYVIESINNLIEYQWSAAPGLILALVRKRDIIGKVMTLSSKWEESTEVQAEWKTKQWFDGWAQRLPLGVISGVMQFFIPELEKFTKTNPTITDENIMNFIAGSTLIGIIPPPPSIVTRNLELNSQSEYFENAYMWTFVYLRSLPYELVPRDKIKLFRFG